MSNDLVRLCARARWGERLTRQMAAMACASFVSTLVSATSTCDPPVMAVPLQAHGNGEAIALQWDGHQQARQFRIWAQWRVPEGEVLHTHEVAVDTKVTQLPSSPARWRPLKLSIEIQTVCDGGAMSQVLRMRQLQFDAREEAACPPLPSARFEHAPDRLIWQGEARDRFELSFHRVEDGRVVDRKEVVGASAEWPTLVARPVVIRAVRACGDAQRSRATFLLVQ